VPSIDIDALLIAIRIASFGHGMDLTTVCPSCNHQEEISVDLRIVNDNLKIGDYAQSLQVGDLEIFFRPISYRDVNENNQMQFEQQQGLRLLSSNDVDEKAKAEQLTKSLAAINELTLKTITQSIAAIKTPGATVSEPAFIAEFLNNCDRAIFARLKDRAIELRQQSEIMPLSLECSNCNHKYSQPFTLDMSSFFGDAS
jgi:transcription elongation factor Elf1